MEPIQFAELIQVLGVISSSLKTVSYTLIVGVGGYLGLKLSK